MKHLFFSLALLNTLALFGAAGSSSCEPAIPNMIIGMAIGKGTQEFPYCVSFNQDLTVFEDQPSRLVGNFYTNSTEAQLFLQKEFLPIFQSFKQPTEVNGFSTILETAFNKELSKTSVSIRAHANIVKRASVTFSFLHLLASGYCNITGVQKSDQAVFAGNWFNGTQSGRTTSPYYSYEYLSNNLFVLNRTSDAREKCAIAGALQAGKSPDDAAGLALDILDDCTEESSEPDTSNVLSFVQLDL